MKGRMSDGMNSGYLGTGFSLDKKNNVFLFVNSI